ncbi:MAG: hypothetical protein KDC98_00715 [Planctomycetes bacterium]|nr:hypothetical protein [Planctomycetota bacterium]
MRIRHLLTVPALLLFASCWQFQITAHAGFSQLSLDGDLGYVSGTTTSSFDQNLKDGFGLGDAQGSPYARVGLDMGTPTLAASAFQFSDEGQGVLSANFGSNLVANTSVVSSFDLTSIKASYAFEIPMGPVSISPGLAVNFVDLSILVRDGLNIASEDVQLQAPLPMLFARAEVDIGIATLVGEGGYVAIDVQDIAAKMLDLEALVQFDVFGPLELFAGYRYINLQGDGLIDDDSFDINLGLSGFLIGGGITF